MLPERSTRSDGTTGPSTPAHPGRDDDRRVEKRRETDHTRNANGEEEQDASKRLEQIARCSQSLKDVRAYECLADVRREPANRRDERNAVRELVNRWTGRTATTYHGQFRRGVRSRAESSSAFGGHISDTAN